jgi:hypothetical protein
MKAILGTFVAFVLISPAFAQSPEGTWNGLPDRFQIDSGYFGINAETVLRYNAQSGSGDVNFEKDLGLDPHVNTFWVDAAWRLGRRHQLRLSYTRLDRDRPDHTLGRDFQWNGETYNAGLSATSTSGSDILGGYYRFALLRSERFEIGPTLGFGYLWLRAGIRATGSIAGPGGNLVSRTLEANASTGSVTGAAGGYTNLWVAKRLVVRGDYLYIKVSPGNTDASIHDWRGGADVYIFRNAGLGVQYKYNRYHYDRGVLAAKLGGDVTYKGFQVFASFLF